VTPRAVDRPHTGIRIERHDDRAGQVEVALGPVARLAQLALAMAAVGDVEQRAHHTARPLPVGGRQRVHAQLEPGALQPPRRAHQNAFLRFAALDRPRHRVVRLHHGRSVLELESGLCEREPASDHRVGSHSQEPSGRAVAPRDHAIRARDQHASFEHLEDLRALEQLRLRLCLEKASLIREPSH
jgi:hypothetical protein